MKTSIFLASAIFFSFLASAQQATTVHSNAATQTSLSGKSSKPAKTATVENSTEVKAEANPKPVLQSGVVVASETTGSLRSQSASAVKSGTSAVETTAGQSASTAASVKSNAQEIKNEAPVAVENKSLSSGEVSINADNKNSAAASINATNNTSAAMSLSKPQAIEKSLETGIDQTLASSQKVAGVTEQTVQTQTSSSVKAAESTTNQVKASTSKAAQVKASTNGSLNTNIRLVRINTNSIIRSGLHIGL